MAIRYLYGTTCWVNISFFINIIFLVLVYWVYLYCTEMELNWSVCPLLKMMTINSLCYHFKTTIRIQSDLKVFQFHFHCVSNGCAIKLFLIKTGRNGRPNSFAICNFQKHKSEFVFVSNDLIWQKFSIWLMEPIFHEPIHTLTLQFEIKMVFKIYIYFRIHVGCVCLCECYLYESHLTTRT